MQPDETHVDADAAGYEAPSVEDVENPDGPAVTAAGVTLT
jgi:hypothetical protein